MGEDEVALVRETIDWPHAPFEVPEEITAAWCAREVGAAREAAWSERFTAYRTAHSALAAEYERRMNGDLPTDWQVGASTFINSVVNAGESVASRQASRQALDGFGPMLPELIGGSADLAGSNLTIWSGASPITADHARGNYIYFGVREFGMSAMTNGLALHGGFLPYCATFLVFSDYARNAIRLSALMKIRAVFVYTHDSIGLGEDGPTHQPVEHMAALRAIPNLMMFRPADATETVECWQVALETKDRPSGLALTRQNLIPARTEYEERNLCAQGAYELISASDAKVSIFASGSEVEIAIKAQQQLEAKGIPARVVSVPCFELFFDQDDAYQEAIIGHAPVKIAVEAGIRQGWDAIIGSTGTFIGMKSFGASGPAKELYKHFGITADAVVAAAEAKLA